MKKQKTLEDQLYRLGLVFLAVGSVGIFLYFQFVLPKISVIPCTLYSMFGLYCPGCGGTRAFRALFEGKILLSFWYHPLVLYTIVIFGGFMLTQTLRRLHVKGIKGWQVHNWHFYGAVILMTANWCIKNFLLYFYNYKL